MELLHNISVVGDCSSSTMYIHMCVHSSVCEVDLGLQLSRVLAEFCAVRGTTSALEREKCPSFFSW